MDYVPTPKDQVGELVGKTVLLKDSNMSFYGTLLYVQGDYYIENSQGLYIVTDFLKEEYSFLYKVVG